MIGVLVRREADFAAAEDAVQEALGAPQVLSIITVTCGGALRRQALVSQMPPPRRGKVNNRSLSMSSTASIEHTQAYAPPPTKFVTAVGAIIAVWCGGFAAISIWFEATDYFGTGEYAESASAFSVVNWVVTAIKAIGLVVALLAVDRRPRLPAPRAVGTLLWAAFATTGIYVLGSASQAALMLTGLEGDTDKIDLASVSYLLLFILAAAGFGILAVSYARRAGLGKREMLLGAVGAPVVLGGVLVVLPAILTASGLLSPS